MPNIQPVGMGTEDPEPGNTFVVASTPYNNCDHFEIVKFLNNIPCVDVADDDLVVL